MPNQTQNLFTGNDLALQGMTQAEIKANKDCPLWTKQVMEYMQKYSLTGVSQFMTEDFAQWAYENGLPMPLKKQAIGGVMRKMAMMNIITHVGHAPSKVPNKHGAIVSVWRILKVEI